MNVRIDAFGMTDVGRHRDQNEDQFFIAELSSSMQVHHTSLPIEDCSKIFGNTQGHLFLVADGLGGHAAGEKASALAITAVATYAVNRLHLLQCAEDEEDVKGQLQTLAEDCHKRLVQSAQRNVDERGMATTLTLAIVMWPQLYVVHVGDSRCYLVREKQIEQLTRDHTLGQLFAESGDDTNVSNGANNALWNVVSSRCDADLVADTIQIELMEGDHLLLCTDGLYNHVTEEAMFAVLSQCDGIEECCNELVRRANADGGKDNITVVLSRFERAEHQQATEPMVETRIPLNQALQESSGFDPHDTDDFVLPPTPLAAKNE